MNTPKKAGRSKAARAKQTLSPVEFFFYENAGYSYDPKTETAEQGCIRCAKLLADAEQKVQNLGWEYEWEWDECPDLSWMSEKEQAQEHEVLCCRIFDPKDEGSQVTGTGYRYYSLASLCGITDPTTSYRRVVEAELALEALAELDKEIETLDAH